MAGRGQCLGLDKRCVNWHGDKGAAVGGGARQSRYPVSARCRHSWCVPACNCGVKCALATCGAAQLRLVAEKCRTPPKKALGFGATSPPPGNHLVLAAVDRILMIAIIQVLLANTPADAATLTGKQNDNARQMEEIVRQRSGQLPTVTISPSAQVRLNSGLKNHCNGMSTA